LAEIIKEILDGTARVNSASVSGRSLVCDFLVIKIDRNVMAQHW